HDVRDGARVVERAEGAAVRVVRHGRRPRERRPGAVDQEGPGTVGRDRRRDEQREQQAAHGSRHFPTRRAVSARKGSSRRGAPPRSFRTTARPFARWTRYTPWARPTGLEKPCALSPSRKSTTSSPGA